MKSKITIFFYFLLFAALVETYYRLQDPVNYLRPTNILIYVDDEMKVFHTKYLLGITKFISGYIMDVIRLSFAVAFLTVLQPFTWFLEIVVFNEVFVILGGLISNWLWETSWLLKCFEVLIMTLSVIILHGISSENKSRATAAKISIPIYDKMILHEGTVLKLQEEVQRLTLRNQGLGKELDRMCALLKKEGVVGTGI